MAAYQTVYTQTHRHTHTYSYALTRITVRRAKKLDGSYEVHSYLICRHIVNTEMTIKQTYTTEK